MGSSHLEALLQAGFGYRLEAEPLFLYNLMIFAVSLLCLGMRASFLEKYPLNAALIEQVWALKSIFSEAIL